MNINDMLNDCINDKAIEEIVNRKDDDKQKKEFMSIIDKLDNKFNKDKK